MVVQGSPKPLARVRFLPSLPRRTLVIRRVFCYTLIIMNFDDPQGVIGKKESVYDAVKDEMDFEKNQRLFREMPSKDFALLVSHLTRPDAFIKTLITGEIASSEELRESFSEDFVKTHREYISLGSWEEKPENDYVSFAIGLPLCEYASESSTEILKKGGLGFVQLADTFLSRSDTVDSEAQLRQPFSRDLFEYNEFVKSEAYEQDFAEAVSFLKGNPFVKYLSKKHILDVLNVARKWGRLDAEHPVEIHISRDEEDRYPRMKVSDTLVLIPTSEREQALESLKKVIEDMKQHSSKLKEMFGVDVANLDAETLLNSYNIYWYPQDNITLAIEYLSTHKEKLESFFRKT